MNDHDEQDDLRSLLKRGYEAPLPRESFVEDLGKRLQRELRRGTQAAGRVNAKVGDGAFGPRVAAIVRRRWPVGAAMAACCLLGIGLWQFEPTEKTDEGPVLADTGGAAAGKPNRLLQEHAHTQQGDTYEYIMQPNDADAGDPSDSPGARYPGFSPDLRFSPSTAEGLTVRLPTGADQDLARTYDPATASAPASANHFDMSCELLVKGRPRQHGRYTGTKRYLELSRAAYLRTLQDRAPHQAAALPVKTRPADASPAATQPADAPMSAEAHHLLEKLRAADAVYRKGLTVTGTIIDGPWPEHPDAARMKREWQLTMNAEYLVLLERVSAVLHPGKPPKEDPAQSQELRSGLILNFPPRQVAMERALITGPDFNADYSWTKGLPVKLGGEDGTRHVNFNGPGGGSKLVVGDYLWALGRGISKHISKITKVTQNRDGTLAVTAPGSGTLSRKTWELVIVPQADYLARSVRMDYMHFENTGVQRFGKACIPAEGTRFHFGPVRLTFRSARLEFDRELLAKAEAMIHAPYPGKTSVLETRLSPTLMLHYAPNEVVGYGGPFAHEENGSWREARQTAKAFLAAFTSGEEEAAKTLLVPGSQAVGQLAGLRKLTNRAKVMAKSVCMSGPVAVVLTSHVSLGVDSKLSAPVLIRLARYNKNFRVEGLDVRVEMPITQRLTDILKRATGPEGGRG